MPLYIIHYIRQSNQQEDGANHTNFAIIYDIIRTEFHFAEYIHKLLILSTQLLSDILSTVF